MNLIESKATISAPQAPLFWLSQDYYLRTRWNSFITEVVFRYNLPLRNILFKVSIGWIVYWFLQRDIKNRLHALIEATEITDILNRLPNHHE